MAVLGLVTTKTPRRETVEELEADPGGNALLSTRAAGGLAAVRLRDLGGRERDLRGRPAGQAQGGCRDRAGGLGVTVVLDGRSLTVEEVVRVARGGEEVELAPDAPERMAAARAVVERAVERDDLVYGLTTGVGVRKRVRVPREELDDFNRRLILNHLVATGPDASAEVVRATMLRLANGFALGVSGVRPELADRVVAALNADELPRSGRSARLGRPTSPRWVTWRTGYSAARRRLRRKASPFSTTTRSRLGWPRSVADARRLLLTVDVAGALDLEAFAANRHRCTSGSRKCGRTAGFATPSNGSVPSSRAAGSGRRARRGTSRIRSSSVACRRCRAPASTRSGSPRASSPSS